MEGGVQSVMTPGTTLMLVLYVDSLVWKQVSLLISCIVSTLLSLDGTALPNAYFGQGNGSMFLANVACNGAEMFLANCTHDFDILSYNCSTHSKDAGVLCLSKCVMYYEIINLLYRLH